MTGSRSHIARLLAVELGGVWSLETLSLSGFCDTWRARHADRSLFIKSGPAAMIDVLRAEQDGLHALAATGTIRVPVPRGCWSIGDVAVLALEWLDLAPADRHFGQRFGQALAALHRATPSEAAGRFGWHRDNMLGATPQPNRWSTQSGLAGWIEFFAAQRLLPMRERLAAEGACGELLSAVDAVVDHLPASFALDDHEPRPAMIHGDLWSGNWGMLVDGSPVIYDPAVSCSDAEAELAMMELFGSPPPGFWAAYRHCLPGGAGYERRRSLYQLYHLLNHAVLFGGGYVRQALAAARNVLA